MPDSGCYLGFDYGKRFIGIATGQTISLSANPLQILTNQGDSIWAQINQVIAEWQPVGLVVGLPLTADGKETGWLKEIRQFTTQLESRFSLPVYTIDEHLSSNAAKDLLNDAAARKIQRLDDKAAAVILQTWLQQQHDRQ